MKAKRTPRYHVVWVIGIAVLLLGVAWVGVSEVRTMGRMCLFSAVQGVVTEGGKPVAGAWVERRFAWAWKHSSGVERARADDAGRFHFDAVWGRSLLGALLPHEPAVEQSIWIEHAGRRYPAWQFTRANYDEQSELFGRPIELACDLGLQPRTYVLEHDHVQHHIYGLCVIKGIRDPAAHLAHPRA